jgi:hypothetical protein
MKTRLSLLLTFIGLGLAGCKSMPVRASYDRSVAFAKLHTFCWSAPPAYLSNDPRLKMDVLEPLVREDIQQQLVAKGFQMTDCATADFYVSFRAALRDSIIEGQKDPDEGGYSVAVYEYSSETGGQWFTSSTDTTVNVQRDGSLIIVILDPKSNRVLWNGTVSAHLRSQVTQEQRKQRLQNVVRLILDKFPPPQGK